MGKKRHKRTETNLGKMRKIRKILIVDDDEVTCYIQKMTLKELNIAEEIDYVGDGLQALRYIEENCSNEAAGANCPILVFLDINMPVMNGFDFLEGLGHLENLNLNDVHIVMLTSSGSRRDIKEASKFADKLKGYITKPLTETAVNKVLQEMEKRD